MYIPLSSLETNGYCPMGFLQPGHGSLIQLSGWYQLNDTASPPYRGQSGTLGKGRQGKKGDQVVVPCTSYPIFPGTLVCFVRATTPSSGQESESSRNSRCLLPSNSFQVAKRNWPSVINGCGLLVGSISNSGSPQLPWKDSGTFYQKFQ